MNRVWHRLHLMGFALVWFVLDRLVKNWIQSHLKPAESIAVIPDVFHLTFVHNTGAAFSLFQQHPSALLAVTASLFTGLLVYSWLKREYTLLEMLGLSLVLGGALGNIVDRLTLGKVIDYLDVVIIHYPVFNLADSFIFIGVCCLLLHHMRKPAPSELS